MSSAELALDNALIRSSTSGQSDPANLRILQGPSPLVPAPEGREGGELRGDRKTGILEDLERSTKSAGGDRPLLSPVPPEKFSTVDERSGSMKSGDPPARPLLAAPQEPSRGADAASFTDSRVTAEPAPAPGRLTPPLTERVGALLPRLLTTLAGSQYLPKGSRIGQCRRWTARVGVSLDGAGSMSVQIIESVTSTPREPHVLPYSGDLVGHLWCISVERIPTGNEQGEAAQAAADERVLDRLNCIGEQMDAIRDEAEVHGAGAMQSVLLRVLRLLTGVARSSGYGCDKSADLRILQDFPPLAPPEGGGGLTSASYKGQESWTTRHKPLLGAQVPRPRIEFGLSSH